MPIGAHHAEPPTVRPSLPRRRRARRVAGCAALAVATLAGSGALADTGHAAAPGSAAAAPRSAAATATRSARPWLMPGQTPVRRADELLARMTLDEKIAMVHGDGFPTAGTYAGHVPANTRLGIPELVLSDGPNGVGDGSTGVTAFPVAVTDAAAWDPALARGTGPRSGPTGR